MFLDFYKIYLTDSLKTFNKNDLTEFYKSFYKIYKLDEDEFFNFFNCFIQLIKLFSIDDYIPNNYIFSDASANVFQHILLISGSKSIEIFKKFNLVNDTQFNDPYEYIYVNLNVDIKIKTFFLNLFPDYINLNINCIDFMFKRKFLKPLLMTFCYKATSQN